MSAELLPRKPMTSDDIVAGMRKRYCAPEWALFFNVANGTGVRGYRYADALGMSLFPSRGLELHGFEIKVSKSDWKREAADPLKAETIAAYCDRWFVVTPPGLLDNENIPPNWGWLAYDGRAFYTKQKAEKTEAKQIDRPFLAALLRRAHEGCERLVASQVEERLADTQAEIARRVANEVERRTRDHKTLQEIVAEFEKSSGVKMDKWSGEEIGRAVAIVRATGIANTYRGTAVVAHELRTAADRIDAALAGLGLPNGANE